MANLTIVRGPSGCGKSTWTRSQAGNPVVVSRDSIREAVWGTNDQDYYNVDKDVLKAKEKVVTKIHNRAIEAGLQADYDVIVDNTHVQKSPVRAAAEIGIKYGANIVIKEFDVSLETALAQNAQRAALGGRNVPEDVIRTQYKAFQRTKGLTLADLNLSTPVAPYNGTPGKPKAFLVDIDGTLAHMRNYRSAYDWANVHLDDVDNTIAELVYDLHARGYTVIVMSGRDAACRGITETWLKDRAAIWFDHLFMRPEDDMRPDNVIKAELFDKHVRDNFDVRFVLDDRDQVVRMWREMGLKCLQVEDGPF